MGVSGNQRGGENNAMGGGERGDVREAVVGGAGERCAVEERRPW
jgi:hypothetical protein